MIKYRLRQFFFKQTISHFTHYHSISGAIENGKPSWYSLLWFKVCSLLEFRLRPARKDKN